MKLNKMNVIAISILFLIIGYYTSSSTIEIVSAVSGLLCVWLAAEENIWNYPVGFVNIACFIYIFYDAKLYADFTLQIVFAVLCAFGWVYWLRNKGDAPVRATKRVTKGEWLIYSAILLLGTIVWGWILQTYTDASIPVADAFIAILSVVAQVLLSKKQLENWWVWIAVDILSIIMYAYKGLDMIAVLYFFFLINAVYGAASWKFEYDRQEAK